MKAIKRKHIAVLGANGLLGADLVTVLKPHYIVTPITKQNYDECKGKSFDIFINANGNSRRWWANQNPVDDFLTSTTSVIKSIFDFPSKTYVYISSVDVYAQHAQPKFTRESANINPEKLEPYGLHKYLAEQVVRKYTDQYLILRPSTILGTNLSKGPIHDVINGKPLFITLTSQLQFITAYEIGRIIRTLLKKGLKKEIINMGGIGTLSLTELKKLFSEVKVSSEATTQVYKMNVEKLKRLYPALKTSEQYLQEFLNRNSI